MPFLVVLDACVLHSAPLRDSLLRLAEANLYVPVWSAKILDETRRSLVGRGIATEGASKIVDAMLRAFPEAAVADQRVAHLEPVMTNHPKDRHVLAAAVASGAELIVTSNLADFPPDACEQHGVETLHPDVFLCDLFDLDPAVTARKIRRRRPTSKTPRCPWAKYLRRWRTRSRDSPRWSGNGSGRRSSGTGTRPCRSSPPGY